jgi:hypothetical protein
LAANSGAFHDIVDGDNKCTFQDFNNVGYSAGPGWDACSGLGSPDGAALSRLLKPMPTSSSVVASRQAPRPGTKRQMASRVAKPKTA